MGDVLAEKGTEGFLHLSDGNEFDLKFLAIQATDIILGNDDVRET